MDTRVEDLVAAVQVSPTASDCFEATPPESGEFDRVFGGWTLAYATNSAIRTVDDPGLRFHSLHANFLRPLMGGVPVELKVERWHDGRSFSTRHVTILQHGRRAAAATVSFHVVESGDEYQLRMDSNMQPPEVLTSSEWNLPFETHDAGPVVDGDGTYRSTRRVWFRLPGQLADDATLHTTLLAYLSDMTGSSFRPHSLDEWGTHTDASLDHALWLHRETRVDDWLFYDLQAVVNSGARGLVRGCLYDATGRLCMSVAQELLIRRL